MPIIKNLRIKCMEKNNKRVIAIHLPQFHPFKENDEWWGKGFTEWTNVTKSKPRFKGHYQPHLPADLGFYDLRLPEIREQQAALAKEYGIYGFCYYHYWFNGHRLMERPVNEILSSGKPDFPFMLCWANENWTRAWDGGEKEILIKQNYSSEDDREHIKYLLKNVFSDPRYIRINNKPVFAIYRSGLFPDIEQTFKVWREEAAKEGVELYLCRFESFGQNGAKHLTVGFDAAIDFQPLGAPLNKYIKNNIRLRIFNKLKRIFIPKNYICKVSYKKYVKFLCSQDFPSYKQYPCITPMWDNSARRKTNIFMLKGSTPKLYAKWFTHIMNKFIPYSQEENFIFINAWNEWAEGNHLEPDRKWGKQYLEMTKKVIDKYSE